VRVLIDYRPALRDRTGVGEFTHQLVKALVSTHLADPSGRPLEVTLFSSSWKDRFRLPSELAGAAVVDRRVPVRVLNLAWHRLGWPLAETLTGQTFDVTHSLHPLLLPSRRAAHVITIHDLNFLAYPGRTRAEIRRDYPVLARRHAHRADRIIVPSRFTAAEVERVLEVPIDRIAVCSPGAPEWSPRQSHVATDGYVLFFGTLEPRKNVGGLLDAYERLLGRRPVPELRLAGKESEEARPWLDRISRPPLAGHVRHIGYVDPSQRRALYEGARVLVQPSFEEGFGLPVLEAMTLGVPVVAADRGALPEVLGDAGLLVNPERPDELASAIERAIDDDSFASAAAAKGVLRARQFRWDHMARRVYEAYALAIEHRQQCASA